jgi:sigma-E factor negative regulatory protein RseA
MVTEGEQNVAGVDSQQNLSALMDGELDGERAGREIFRLKTDAPARQAWDAYHLIGDAMRGNARSPTSVSTFGLRFSELLAQEPTVLAPVTNLAKVGRGHDIGAPVPRVPRKLQSYALSAAASVAAVAVVGWAALNLLQQDAPVIPAGGLATAPAAIQPPRSAPMPPLAAAPQVQAVPAAAEPVHEYLLAHQGISPTTAIQGVAPYVRTISSTGE